MLSSASESSPQILEIRVSLVTTFPLFTMSRRSTSNSLKPSRTDRSPADSRREVQSRLRSFTVSTSLKTSP